VRWDDPQTAPIWDLECRIGTCAKWLCSLAAVAWRTWCRRKILRLTDAGRRLVGRCDVGVHCSLVVFECSVVLFVAIKTAVIWWQGSVLRGGRGVQPWRRLSADAVAICCTILGCGTVFDFGARTPAIGKHVAGFGLPFRPRGGGRGIRGGVGTSAGRIGKAGGVVTELAEHSDHSQSGQTPQDRRVRVQKLRFPTAEQRVDIASTSVHAQFVRAFSITARW